MLAGAITDPHFGRISFGNTSSNEKSDGGARSGKTITKDFKVNRPSDSNIPTEVQLLNASFTDDNAATSGRYDVLALKTATPLGLKMDMPYPLLPKTWPIRSNPHCSFFNSARPMVK